MDRHDIQNCLLLNRRGEKLFTKSKDGTRLILDGYAIIPLEMYMNLRHSQGICSDATFPCAQCGATEPTAEGHDPCIANLPGVANACCGHGQGEGYVMFEDGRVLRGRFDHVLESPRPSPQRAE